MPKTLTFTNSQNESFVMTEHFPNYINELTGIEGNSGTVQTDKSFAQHGENLYGYLDGARIINAIIRFNYSSPENGRIRRRDIMRIFNPRLGLGLLEYQDEYSHFKINAIVAKKPEIYKVPMAVNAAGFDIIFLCPDPDLLSYDEQKFYITSTTGGLTFPITFPITFGTISGEKEITYYGDNPANVVLDIRPIPGSGAMSYPRLQVSNSEYDEEYIEIDYTVNEGEKILINTNLNSPSITHVDISGNETDIWENLVFGSTLFQLYFGDNTISLTAALGRAETYITFNQHFA